jgi:hypothetical protein
VFAGEGFTGNMRSFLISTGKAVEYHELRPWLCLFFGLPLGANSNGGGPASESVELFPRAAD